MHAGEGRPPSEIRTAIEELGAQRIGHGTTLLSGVDTVEAHARVRALPGMTDELLERAIAHGHAAAFSRAAPLAGPASRG